MLTSSGISVVKTLEHATVGRSDKQIAEPNFEDETFRSERSDRMQREHREIYTQQDRR